MPQLIIQTGASKIGWGSLSVNHHGGNLVISGNDKTYQRPGAHCSKTCNTFPKGKLVTAIHLQIENMTALS